MTTADRHPAILTPPATSSPAPPDPGVRQGGTGPWFRVGMGAAGVLILAVVFAGVTGWQGRHEVTVVAPDPVASAAAAVTWSHYLPGFREQLAADSCTDLDEAYRAARLVDGPVDSHPVEAYIAALAVAKGCVL